MSLIVILVFVVIATIIAVIHDLNYPKRIKNELKQNYEDGLKEPLMPCFHHYYKTLKQNPYRTIDHQTWNDLDLDKMTDTLNYTQSMIGESYLYAACHQLKDQKTLLDREAAITYFSTHSKERTEIQYLLYLLGKSEDMFVEDLPQRVEGIQIKGKPLFHLFAYLPILMLIFIPFNPNLCIALVFAALCVNVVLYLYANIYISKLDYLLSSGGMMIIQAKKILPYIDSSLFFYPVMQKMVQFWSPFIRSFEGVTKIKDSDLRAMLSLFRYFTLKEARCFFKIQKQLTEHPHEYMALYETLGEIELCIAVAAYRHSLDQHYCLPKFIESSQLIMTEGCHPLLPNGIANSLTMDGPIMLTGSNASGKSTFLKAVAVNMILAQTIHTATAQAFEMKPCLIVSSMAIQDHLLEGESYFIAEIKSLKRLLDFADHTYCFCLVDEILRGTNTYERLLSSSAVCHYLSQRESLSIIATHDIELTAQPNFKQYHFEETIKEDSIYFDYLLKPGPSHTMNAIKLLKIYGFNQNILDWIDNQKKCDTIKNG
ncbi:MAG: MutS-related protein [Beduini sp.]|uniref:MutS-related protein n=1 Tax=Beduini sp. TaxID=1922300 RepID=UPI0039A0ACA5